MMKAWTKEQVNLVVAAYLREVACYVLRIKRRNKFPNERLMRQIENVIGITEVMVTDFRNTIMSHTGANYILNRHSQSKQVISVAKAVRVLVRDGEGDLLWWDTDQSREFLIRAGIITKSGKRLSNRYR
jgi:hypothetical protein